MIPRTLRILMLALCVLSACAIPALAATMTVTPSSSVAAGTDLSSTLTAPISAVGAGTGTLGTAWTPSQAEIAGDVVGPEGWTVEFTADGITWSTTRPSASAIRGVRARGPIESDGTSDGRQLVRSTGTKTVSAVPVFPAASGGDGYSVFTTPRFALTAYHHETSLIITCNEKSSGSTCSPATYTLPGYTTSYASNGVVLGTRAYVMAVRNSDGAAGLTCTNVASLPFSDCGFTVLEQNPYAGGPQGTTGVVGSISVSGTRIYGVIQRSNSAPSIELACFDTATGAPCGGQPYALPQTTGVMAFSVGFTTEVAGRIFVTSKRLYCFNGADASTCPGWDPNGYSTMTIGTGVGADAILPLVPMRNASGTPTGVCKLYPDQLCWNFDHTSATFPAGLYSMLSTTGMSQYVTYYGFAQFGGTSTRQLWTTPGGTGTQPSYPVCYDWTTDAPCSNFTSPGSQEMRYSVTTDQFAPNCAYTYGNSGIIQQFSATYGGASCMGGPEVDVQVEAPRFSCAAQTGGVDLKTVTISAPSGASVTSFRVTVRDSSGAAIPGYVDLTPTASGSVNIAGLTSTMTGSSPSIAVGAVGLTNTQAGDVVVTTTQATGVPQLCVPLKTLRDCPAADTLVPGQSAPASDLVLTGTVTEAVGAQQTSTEERATVTRSAHEGCPGTKGTGRKPVDVQRVTVTPTGITSVVAVTTAGRVRQVGTFGSRRTTACTASRTISRPGTVRLTCRFTAAARTALERRGLRVRLVTTLTSRAGVRTSVVRIVRVPRAGALPVTG